jgi:hypothetical protein
MAHESLQLAHDAAGLAFRDIAAPVIAPPKRVQAQ